MTPSPRLWTRSMLAAAAAALAAWMCAAGPAPGAPRDDFNLGRSGISGAVCQAQRDFDDPLAARAGRRAWQVRCRGWGQALGRIYYLEGDPQANAAEWLEARAPRAACDAATQSPLPKAPGATAVRCKSLPLGAAYVAYQVSQRHALVAAEGLSGVADVLAAGLQVAAGRIRAPAAIADQAGEGVGGQIESLNAVAAAAGQSLEQQREDAYREAQLWRFGEAEARFSSLALANMSQAERAEAYLNIALNASNSQQFVEADTYFRLADPLVEAARSSALKGLALNDKAAHARNQRRFEEAIALGLQANAVREREVAAGGLDVVKTAGGDVRLGAEAAAALNAQGRGLNIQLSPHQEALIRDAQALQVMGTSQEALHRDADARVGLLQGAALLDESFGGHRLGDYAPWLAARIQADIARLDRNRGDTAVAVARLQRAAGAYDARYPGSLVAGHFLIELARAKAADRQEDEALKDYEAAFEIFREKRGSLGPSADVAGTYFDILLHRIGGAPEAHPDEVRRFFDSSEALVGESTAAAALQFAERLTSGGSAIAGLARARDATLRQIEEKQAVLRQAEQVGTVSADQRKQTTAEVEALRVQANDLEQKMFAADPRYGNALKTDTTLPDLQHSLQPGEAYAKILILANRGYGFLITPTGARPYAIELNRAQARQLATQLRKPFDEAGETGRLARFDVGLAHTLYAKLFGPVEPQLAQVRRLIYQPDPTLVGVPVGVLVTDEASLQVMHDNLQAAIRDRTALSYNGVSWLAERMQSSVAVSTAAFVNSRRMRESNAPKPFLGFADPVIDPASPAEFASVAAPAAWVRATGVDVCADMRHALLNLPPLPETAREVAAVAAAVGAPDSVIQGAAFTDERVRDMGAGDALAQYRVLYFATHGLLPQANGCLQPALVTSPGLKDSDGLLDVKEIPDLKLDADLVVLSACNTGQSSDGGGGGAALGGLAATFTYAGARNLLVSNWEVDSAATEALMATLFTAKAATQGEALSAAQHAFIARGDAYSHPFYWAAFSLVGDSARPAPRMTTAAAQHAQTGQTARSGS